MEGKWMKKTQTRTADFSSFLPAILLCRFQVFFKRVLLFQWGEKPIFVHPFYSSRQELVSGIKMFCPKKKKKMFCPPSQGRSVFLPSRPLPPSATHSLRSSETGRTSSASSHVPSTRSGGRAGVPSARGLAGVFTRFRGGKESLTVVQGRVTQKSWVLTGVFTLFRGWEGGSNGGAGQSYSGEPGC